MSRMRSRKEPFVVCECALSPCALSLPPRLSRLLMRWDERKDVGCLVVGGCEFSVVQKGVMSARPLEVV